MLIIRPSLPQDSAGLQAVYAPAVLSGTASFELEPPDIAEMARRRDHILALGYPYLVAEERGRIVGYAYAGPYHPRAAYRTTTENSIYIAPDQQGKGIGKALMAPLIEACENMGLRQMMAVIGDSTNHGSIRLHAHFGFAHIGTTRNVGYKLGRWLDVVFMQRPLGVGADLPP
jgi:L-amino acid N-acyltransferase YncA